MYNKVIYSELLTTDLHISVYLCLIVFDSDDFSSFLGCEYWCSNIMRYDNG